MAQSESQSDGFKGKAVVAMGVVRPSKPIALADQPLLGGLSLHGS